MLLLITVIDSNLANHLDTIFSHFETSILHIVKLLQNRAVGPQMANYTANQRTLVLMASHNPSDCGLGKAYYTSAFTNCVLHLKLIVFVIEFLCVCYPP